MDSEDALSAFLYFVTVVTSLGAAGSTAERCEVLGGTVSCPDRIKVFIAFGFLTAFIAAALLVVSALSISIIKRFELFVSPFVVVFAVIACAVGTSVKTIASISLPTLLVWYSLISASGAMFLALKNVGQHLPSKEKLVDPHPVSIPMNGSVASTIPMQPVQQPYQAPAQQAYQAPAQPVVVGTPYSATASPGVNTTA